MYVGGKKVKKQVLRGPPRAKINSSTKYNDRIHEEAQTVQEQGQAKVIMYNPETGKTTVSYTNVNYVPADKNNSKSSSSSRNRSSVIDDSKRLSAKIVEASTKKVVQKGNNQIDRATERAIQQEAIGKRHAIERLRNRPKDYSQFQSRIPGRSESFINSSRQGNLRNGNQKNIQKPINNNSRFNNNFFNLVDGNSSFNVNSSSSKRKLLQSNGLGLVNSNNLSNISGEQTLQQQRTITDKERLNSLNPVIGPVKSNNFLQTNIIDNLNKPYNYVISKTGQFSDYLVDVQRESSNSPKESLLGLGSFVSNIPRAFDEFAFQPVNNFVRNPIYTTDKIVTDVVKLQNPTLRDNAITSFNKAKNEFSNKLQAQDPRAWSELAYNVASTKFGEFDLFVKGAGKTYQNVRFIGKEKIDPLQYYDKVALQGKFPKANSIQEVDNLLLNANNKVVTASPGKLNSNVASDSRKSALGLEDPGIYVSPKGTGNSYFHRLGNVNSKYSFNPAKILETYKSYFQSPTLTEFKTKGSTILPQNVLNQKGFSKIGPYHEDVLAGTGKVVHTKRSMLGKGELNEKGVLGTSEIELVVPKGQTFQELNFNKFTIVNGKKVAIREAELITSKKFNLNNDFIDKKLNKKLRNEQSFNSYYETGMNHKSPYSLFSKTNLLSSKRNLLSSSSPVSPGISKRNLLNPSSPVSPGTSKTNLLNPSSPVSPGISNTNFLSSSSPVSPGISNTNFPSPSSPISPGTSNIFSTHFINTNQETTRLPSWNSEKALPKNKYNSYVKRYGRVVKLNSRPLSLSKAINLGKRTVDNTLAASFEVRGSTRITKPVRGGKKFTAKMIGGTGLAFKEKTEFRKDTRGERREFRQGRFRL